MFHTRYVFNWLELSIIHLPQLALEVIFCKQALQTTAEKQRGIEKPSIHKTSQNHRESKGIPPVPPLIKPYFLVGWHWGWAP